MTERSVSLRRIFSKITFPYSPSPLPKVAITGIAIDSRTVRPGDLFVALKGESVDGHDFIPKALRSGAAAVVGEKTINGLAIPYIKMENTRMALSWISAAFYDSPGNKLCVIGVTGTDGKTTTTNLIYEILKAADINAGMISTVNAVIGKAVLDTGFHVTTPDAHDVQRLMAMMVDAGLTHIVLETTSHGWAQHRIDACEFDIGVVTNITHEHLDQHGSYESYRSAKARLFSNLEITGPKTSGNPRLSVLNNDDGSFDYLNNLIKGRKVSYGLGEGANIRAVDCIYSLSGIQFSAIANSFRVNISSHLIGPYNISNILASLAGTVVGLGIQPETAARGVAALQNIPGRMERIELGQDFIAIVDFAHTPNALKVTLEAAHDMVKQEELAHPGNAHRQESRVIAVFGSAGRRDKEKRRLMAATSAELADLTILTAEDPRTESLDGILKDMAAGAVSAGGIETKTFWRIPDRGEAIKFAVNLARPGDVVLACGKGHEQSMCFGEKEYPWDDRIAMRAAIGYLSGKTALALPYLPTQDKTEVEWLK